jgi:plastocyanin
MKKKHLPVLLVSALICLVSEAATLKVMVVDADGVPVEEAVVSVHPASGTAPKVLPSALSIVKQEKMQFVPKVTLVTPGSKLRFVNMDPWDHHIRATTGNQFGVDYAPLFQARENALVEGKAPQSFEVTVDAAGVVLLGCHLHSSMTGYVYVADSPWAAKTGVDGIATLDDLPTGDVKVTLWQANEIKTIPVKGVTLIGPTTVINYQLSVKVRKRRA